MVGTVERLEPDCSTYAAIAAAGEIVARELAATPLVGHPLLDRAVGTEVLVKHEHVLPTGSFKVRGGVHLAARLTDRERASGLVTCSTGNHAQSVAYAARLAGCHATVVMPACAPQVKRDAVEAFGATVVMHGASLGESAQHAREARDRRRRSVVRRHHGPADHPRPRDRLPRAVPAGPRPRRGLRADRQRDRRRRRLPGPGRPDAGLPGVGVQSAAAPAAWRSWRSGAVETAPATTRASGSGDLPRLRVDPRVPAGRPPRLPAGVRRRHRSCGPAARLARAHPGRGSRGRGAGRPARDRTPGRAGSR